jgi:hypothetical protein
VLAALALLGFIALTNRWVSYATALHQFNDSDSLSYRAMASAAPGLLHRRIPEWHAERFSVHYLIGSASKLFDVSLSTSYLVAVILVVIAICLVVVDVLGRLSARPPVVIALLALFLLNPYAVRPDLIEGSGIADLLFVLGIAIAVRGLVVYAPVSVVGGLLLATIARQTALPVALVATAAILLDGSWRLPLGRGRFPFAALCLLLPVATYLGIRAVAHGFSGPSPRLHAMTLLGSTHRLGTLAQHFTRSITGLLPIIALLIASWWIRRSALRAGIPTDGPAPGGSRDPRLYVCLAVGAAIVIQPFLLNPKWAAYNEARLGILGLVPLIVALGIALTQGERLGAVWIRSSVGLGLLVLLALGSFHGEAVIGASNRGERVALQVVVALAASAMLVRWASGEARRTA